MGTHLNAVCGNKVDGKFTYVPPAGKRLESGQHTVLCRFVPLMENNYHSVEVSRDFYVHRAFPTLLWRNPNPTRNTFVTLYFTT